jgi:hypothetical protein
MSRANPRRLERPSKRLTCPARLIAHFSFQERLKSGHSAGTRNGRQGIVRYANNLLFLLFF